MFKTEQDGVRGGTRLFFHPQEERGETFGIVLELPVKLAFQDKGIQCQFGYINSDMNLG